jgi:hypothetical protein
MVNLTHAELAEITPTSLPPASLEALQDLRTKLCNRNGEFQLQSHQRFLRRVLSPDSPTRNLLMVHGTGVGKTCTAIQIAEEYILRPEFQDKKVMVVASRAVQENFRTQVFDMSRVYLDDAQKLLSQQCTGRRYLDMLMRMEPRAQNWNDPRVRDKLDKAADRIIDEFYEFAGYNMLGAEITQRLSDKEIHEKFDNRLLIIDEAHNIRNLEETKDVKGITEALERLVKTADGLVVVLLTATPMYDSYEEIIFFINLFLWNDRKQAFTTRRKLSDFFNSDATLKAGKGGEEFRTWCQDYVSYVKGESPFTFPFRLPPPVPAGDLGVGFDGKTIGDDKHVKRLSLVASTAAGEQNTVLKKGKGKDDETKRVALQPTIAVLPGNKEFNEVMKSSGGQYTYRDADKPFLKPEFLPMYSAKFAKVIQTIETSSGVVLVYSNYKQMGTDLFAMALEEHGYRPAAGTTLLQTPSKPEAKKTYMLLTSATSDRDLADLIQLSKDRKNVNGDKIRVIITSPAISEGVDFRFVRQVHILDPWWNMSRLEQVAGRALRTCSHALLPFEHQNCTVYYHVVRTDDGRECYDEFTYRTRVEKKAEKIAIVRRVMEESAMDCPLQNQVNVLPADWKNLEIEQVRSEGNQRIVATLSDMMAPEFSDLGDVSTCIVKPSIPDPDHVRPLSSYLDVRDELLAKLSNLFLDKPIWDRNELLAALSEYSRDVVIYTLQQAIATGYSFTDAFRRPSLLESKGDLYALAPNGVPSQTVVDRTTEPAITKAVDMEPIVTEIAKPQLREIPETFLDEKRLSYEFPPEARARFSDAILNGYIFDHALTTEEKVAYLREHGERVPFSNRLKVPGTNYIVLGDGTFDPEEIPVGGDLTKYQDWEKRLVSGFIEKRTKLFASLTPKGMLTVSKMTESMERNLEKNQKRFEPIACGTGANDKKTMLAFAKHIDGRGEGVPESLSTRGSRWCMYIELLAREEHNCFWVTPEELDVLYSPENEKKFRAVFKQ